MVDKSFNLVGLLARILWLVLCDLLPFCGAVTVIFLISYTIFWAVFTLFMWWLGIKTGELRGHAKEIGSNNKALERLQEQVDYYKKLLHDEGEWWKFGRKD